MPTTKLNRFTVHYTDKEEYHLLKREIFGQDTYFVDLADTGIEKPPADARSEDAAAPFTAPYIIDAGAHIGLSTLYFKHLFPTAEIVAIEPDPQARKLLEMNLFENDFRDVRVEAVALGESVGTRPLFRDPNQRWLSTSSLHRGSWQGDQDTDPHQVQVVPLAEFLDRPVDILKLDIEGVEQLVLETTPLQNLRKVQTLLIEFHPRAGQSLQKIVTLLEDADFEVSFRKNGQPVSKMKAKGLVVVVARRK